MTGDLSRTVAHLLHRVGQARGALLMDLDGVPIELAARGAGTDLESVTGEYTSLLRQAQTLATELDLGAAKGFSVRAATQRVVFAFVPGDLVLGVEAGATGLRGQMRYALAEVQGQLGER